MEGLFLTDNNNQIITHVWGFFCLIFWATYLAQIAAFYTSYLPTYEITDFNDGIVSPLFHLNLLHPFHNSPLTTLFSIISSFAQNCLQLMPMRTGVVRSSSAEGYLRTENVMLWHHIENYRVNSVEEGIDRLRYIIIVIIMIIMTSRIFISNTSDER